MSSQCHPKSDPRLQTIGTGSADVEGRTKPGQAAKDHGAVLHERREDDGGDGNLDQHACLLTSRASS